MPEAPIFPVKQTRITIAGTSFTAVLLTSGETGLVLSELCEFLGLLTNDQAHRLRLHPTLSTALVLVKIETAGGPHIANVLLSWGIMLWLERIRHGRRPTIYRERLLAFQQDARAALSKEFFRNVSEEPPSPKRENPSTSLKRPPSVREARQAIRKAREALAQAEEQWMDLVEQQVFEIRPQRLEGQPARSRPPDPDGSMPLTVLQHEELITQLRQLQRLSRVPLAVLVAQVADHCGADHLSAISQAAWPEALAWVRRRLGAQ